MHFKLALIGFGNVARALARLLERKQQLLLDEHAITFSFTGIATGHHGFAINPSGLDIDQALKLAEDGKSIAALSATEANSALEVIRRSQADVMFENSPVNHENGRPAIDHVRAALQAGMHAITANKGTVVFGYKELRALAERQGREFLFESTVLGGSPVFSVFRECMPTAELHSFRGVLNSTSNIILSRMERGEMFDEAVRYCQSIGVAETDPAADVDGWDAAIKVAALVTVLMGISLTPKEVQRTGIREISREMVEGARADGKRYRLVCSAEKMDTSVRATVSPQLVTAADPLYGMQDSTTGIAFRTDVLGDYSIIESEREGMVAGPEPTAYGLLADFVRAAEAQMRAGKADR
jgi:homoserine dehydrogenase